MARDKYRQLLPAQARVLFDRVGVDQMGRLAWALKFAQQEFGSLPAGDLENLRQELSIFGFMGTWPDLAAVQRGSKLDTFLEGLELPETMEMQIVSDKELSSTHAKFKKVLSDLEDNDGYAEVGPFTLFHVVETSNTVIGMIGLEDLLLKQFLPFAPGPQASHRQKLEGGQSDFLLFGFSALLARYSLLLRHCPDMKCKRWFVASRLNQQYCSTKCQVRSATRKFRSVLGSKKKATRKRQAKKTTSKQRRGK